jgi:hypothetical protein
MLVKQCANHQSNILHPRCLRMTALGCSASRRGPCPFPLRSLADPTLAPPPPLSPAICASPCSYNSLPMPLPSPLELSSQPTPLPVSLNPTLATGPLPVLDRLQLPALTPLPPHSLPLPSPLPGQGDCPPSTSDDLLSPQLFSLTHYSRLPGHLSRR